MEKEEKKRKIRGLGYFNAILDRWGALDSTICTKEELYKIMDDLSKEMGYSIDRTLRAKNLRKIEEILMPKWIERIEDTSKKRRGKGRNYIYSLKIENSGIEKNKGLEDIKSTMKEYFSENSYERKVKTPKVLEENKIEEAKKNASRPRLRTLEHIWEVLEYMSKNNTNTMRCTELRALLGLQNFSAVNLDGWIKTLGNVGVDLNAKYYTDSSRLGFVKIHNVNGTKVALMTTAKKYYDINLKSEAGKLHSYTQGKTKVYQNPTTIVRIVNEDDIKGKLIFAIGGLISTMNGGKSVDVDVVCSELSKKFQLQVTRKEILDTLKEVDEFNVNSYSNRIGLKMGRASWFGIREKYGPETRKKVVFARLTLPLEEIKEKFPETEVLSIVSGNDAFYKITYPESKHSLKNWTILYRKFRGVDNIFDEVLKNEIEKEIQSLDIRSFKDDTEYIIEEDDEKMSITF